MDPELPNPDPEVKPKHIRFCINNPRNLAERRDLFDRGFVCRDCLSNCTRCFETRFLEIQGELVEGEDYDEILSTLPNPPARPDPADPGADA